jgi:putative addiction module component (TIGR02574 family)
MDVAATINEITALTIDERIYLVQAIWDSIAAEEVYPSLSAAQQQELDRRIIDYELHPNDVLTWAEIKASIKASK